MEFRLFSGFKPTGDQPQAIEKLVKGVRSGLKNQVLLGVTGSGKTFTIANVIERLQMPTLIISHNKTLAGQLYQEMRDFFPKNGVSYFVSYYDYYQPEAYIPQTDTYIEKEAEINDLIDKLRLQATTNILTRKDTIVVASVSAIYNIGSPLEWRRFVLELVKGEKNDMFWVMKKLAELQYQKTDFDFRRASFRNRGYYLDIFPAYDDWGIRVYFDNDQVSKIVQIDPITSEELEEKEKIIIYPAKHFLASSDILNQVESTIRRDLGEESKELENSGRKIEAARLIQRVNYDLSMIKEVGYVNGIENYSRYFDGRKPGEPPFTLIDYFIESYGKDWLLVIDESHMTIPQLKGMYRGDYSRKKTLVEFGFRLKAAFDNRPLKFEEFYPKASFIIYVSATPDEWEINMALNEAKLKNQNLDGLVEQLVRPTGIVDPEIEIRPAKNEIKDLFSELKNLVKKKQRALVTTLTKKMAEELCFYLRENGIKVEYLHSDIETLERSDILDNLRSGRFDVLVGVNLLREGLDLPEVSMVAILDADKEGFLRSKTALIQMMGRAARNINGKVILYADRTTNSIREAKQEIERRRKYQLEYNKKNKIAPRTINKPIREKIIKKEEDPFLISQSNSKNDPLLLINPDSLTSYDKKKIIKKLSERMKEEAQKLNFEVAILYRDKIRKLKN